MRKYLRLWPIALTLFIALSLVYFFGKLGNSDSFNVVLGISLGVFMGFLVDLSKKVFDAFAEEEKLKKTAFKLLEQDAKSVYRTFDMYKGLVASKNQPNAPEGIEFMLPPVLEMRYWKKLKTRDEFLSLAIEPPFDEIFKMFFEFEKLNDLMRSARENPNEERRKGEYNIALAISRQVLEDNDYESFVRLFLNKKQFEEYKENWKKRAKD